MSPECRNCGSHVTEEYVRVLSRDGEAVDACPDDDCDNIRTDGRIREMRSEHGTRDRDSYIKEARADD